MNEKHDHPHDRKVCVDLAERISEYLDGELPGDLRLEVEEHVEHCSTCEKFVDSVRRTRDLAHLLPPRELPPDRLKSISEAVKRRLEE
jgi:anti-sigma factor RsiW